ncbi:fetal and adult testis-expressed transcript protein [Rousettus aegyptiacus]|uniref:Fetal and adult testis expressed 1 n=1 Tax=Rousettus aegyptiacus TaxID=9407 RepID=A0A7J8EJQ2_ROUAE|nr:fetal and adult testis-expressed transcript protein [Rousettus aegyptiacus]KAF6435379.1 fetal and adult testis expressed 1 [Rousettus aegyptiacus]
MAGSSSNIKEEVEMSMVEEMVPGIHGQDHERLRLAEILERGSWSLGAPQRRQKLDSKAAGSAAGQPAWNTSANQPKKAGAKLPMPKTSREQDHGDASPQEYPRDFQAIRFHYENSPEADIIAEIGLEELNELEMEVMRSQLRVITGRLCALEDQGATARQREALFFTMLLSACVVNLWLWMRQ